MEKSTKSQTTIGAVLLKIYAGLIGKWKSKYRRVQPACLEIKRYRDGSIILDIQGTNEGVLNTVYTALTQNKELCRMMGMAVAKARRNEAIERAATMAMWDLLQGTQVVFYQTQKPNENTENNN